MERILVTGAGGYVGSHLAEYFASRGFDVTGALHEHGFDALRRAGIKTLPLNLLRADSLKELFSQHWDYVVCAAARSSKIGTDELFRQTDFDSLRLLAVLAEKSHVKRIVYISGTDVFGFRDFSGESEETLAYDFTMKHPSPKYRIQSEEWLISNLVPSHFSIVRPCTVWGGPDCPYFHPGTKPASSVVYCGPWRGRNNPGLSNIGNVCRTAYAALILPDAAGKGVNVLDSEPATLSEFRRAAAKRCAPELRLKEFALPGFLPFAALRLADRYAAWLQRDRPFFRISYYDLMKDSHNMKFSNARMLDWLAKAGEKPVSFEEGTSLL